MHAWPSKLEAEMAAAAGGIATEHVVHQCEQLLHTLVHAQILAALHQEGVLPLVVAPANLDHANQ